MKVAEEWTPSKFIMREGRLRPSLDAQELATGSRLVAQCMGSHYQKALQGHARGRLLDLGCGKVPLYAVYRDLVDETVCVDWRNSLHDGKHVDYFRDLNGDLDLPGQPFDTILLSDVLEHIRRPEQLLARLHGLLRPSGKVIIGVPFFYCIHEAPYDFFRYTRFALAAMAKDCGFDLCSLDEVGGAIEIIGDLFGKLAGPAPLLQRGVVALFTGLCRLPLVRRLSDKTKARFPLGYLMVIQRPLQSG